MSKHETEPVPEGHFGAEEFDEDHTILSILCSKVFRRAIDQGGDLVLPPDIEKEALDAVDGQDGGDVWTMADVESALARWKEALAVGQAS